jgi:hypothetical protein
VFAILLARLFSSFQLTTSSSHISAIALGILAALPSTSSEKEEIWAGAGGLVVAATNKTFRSPRKLVIAPIFFVSYRVYLLMFEVTNDNGCDEDGTSDASNVLKVINVLIGG